MTDWDPILVELAASADGRELSDSFDEIILDFVTVHQRDWEGDPCDGGVEMDQTENEKPFWMRVQMMPTYAYRLLEAVEHVDEHECDWGMERIEHFLNQIVLTIGEVLFGETES